MRNALTIARRELSAYFLSPIAYIVMFVFVVISSFFFAVPIFGGRAQATMAPTFGTMSFVLLFFTPAITMRLLSEERRAGTIEMLMTAPVTDLQVVIGKFCGAMVFFAALLTPTLFYVVALRKFGDPDMVPILVGYVGLLLLAGPFLSIGLFISSLTRNQIVAAVATFVALLLLWVVGLLSQNVSGWLATALEYIGLFVHIDTFTRGIIDTRDVVYYLSWTTFFLFLAVRSLEARRWS